jgi:CRISPR-associated protein Csb2
MALAAAWFETGEDVEEGRALRWLESLDDPQLILPPSQDVFRRDVVDYYVPVNDTEPPSLDSNKIAKRLAGLNDSELAESATAISEEIDKSAKTAIGIPSVLRIELLHRIRRISNLSNLRTNLAAKLAAVDYKEFVFDALGTVPQFRGKQPRTFPTVWVGESHCFLCWPTNSDASQHRVPLDRLCGKVTRIGHSSSLVRMWLADESHSPQPADVWVPADGLAELQVRRVSNGTLDLLDRQFNGRGRAEHDRLSSEIEALDVQKKAIRGRGAAVAAQKAELDRQIGELQEQVRSVDARPPIRPKLGLWTGYRRQVDTTPAPVRHTEFDGDLLILTQTDGARLPLVSTLAVTQALRGTVMSQSGVQPPPSWVSGHLDDCQPLRDGRQHLAYVPLPFVGADYADGHLLGLALAFPRGISRQDRGRVLGRLLSQPSGEAKPVKLTLGQLGTWTLVKRDWSETRRGLTPEAWTAHPAGATTWATVTPVVLDRFPKADPRRERVKWNVEVADIIATACRRLGLAGPAEIRFGTTSWHRGSPRASVKRRPLREHVATSQSAALGDGFPTYPAKGTNGERP